jgi:PAS domain S-box-containing protein
MSPKKKSKKINNDMYNNKRRNKSFAKFLQSSSEQIVITDIKGKVLFVNDKLLKTTGYSLNEIIGKTPALWGGNMPNFFYKFMWQKISEEKKPISIILTNMTKSGEFYDVRLRISPVLNASGKIEFFVGVETKL